MALYGVQRMEKYKIADVAGLQGEAQRTAQHYNNNVDPERTDNNIYFCKCDNWAARIRELTTNRGVRMRKDSVVAIGGVYTASPDFFTPRNGETVTGAQERAQAYFTDCLNWHIRKYCGGNPNLVLSAVVHHDEDTPHLQIYSVPLQQRDRGRYGTWALSAKSILGNQTAYTKRVTEFHQTVSAKYGLERGEYRDGPERKKHITAQQYRAAQAQAQAEIAREQESAALASAALAFQQTADTQAKRKRAEQFRTQAETDALRATQRATRETQRAERAQAQTEQAQAATLRICERAERAQDTLHALDAEIKRMESKYTTAYNTALQNNAINILRSDPDGQQWWAFAVEQAAQDPELQTYSDFVQQLELDSELESDDPEI